MTDEEQLQTLKERQAAKMVELSKLMDYEPKYSVVWGELGTISNSINDILARTREAEIQKLEQEFFQTHKRRPRRNHCFKCRKDLFEVERDICRRCNWMICDVDAACGCEYLTIS